MIEADQYAYAAAKSTWGFVPAWALEGKEKIAERLNSDWARIVRDGGAAAERGLTDLSFAVVASARSDASLAASP